MKKLKLYAKKFDQSKYDARTTIILLLFVSCARMMLELSVRLIPTETLVFIFLDFFTFYTIMFFSFSLILSFLTEKPFYEIANYASAGLMLGVLPPILDFTFAKSTSAVKYKYFSKLNWLLAEKGQGLGETFTLWILIFAMGILIFQLTNSSFKSALGIFFSYSMIQFLSLLVIVSERYSSTLNSVDSISGISFSIFSFLFYASMRRSAIRSAFFRILHGSPHFFLVLAGSVWAGSSMQSSLTRAFLVLFLIFIMLIQNDYYDHKEDKSRVYKEKLIYNDMLLTSLFGFLFIVQFYKVYPYLIFLSILFLLSSYLYHHEAFRLKERFCLSYTIEGVWTLLAFLMGVINFSGFPQDLNLYIPCLLAFGGGCLLSIPKDWKDIEGDRSAKIPTFYVIFSHNVLSELKVHRIITTIVFLSQWILPIYFVSLHKTFVPMTSILFSLLGAISLLYITNKKLSIQLYIVNISLYIVSLTYAMNVN